jgi:hypothetical protein
MHGMGIDDYIEDHTTNIIESFHCHLKNRVMNHSYCSLEYIVENCLYMWDSYMLPTIREYEKVDFRVNQCIQFRRLHMYEQLCYMEDQFQCELRMGMVMTLRTAKKLYWSKVQSQFPINNDFDFNKVLQYWPHFANMLANDLHLHISTFENMSYHAITLDNFGFPSEQGISFVILDHYLYM